MEKHSEFVEEKIGPLVEMFNEEDRRFLDSFPADKRKRMLRKIDWRLVPMLMLLYLVTYIDKVNIGNAQIEGLLPGLHIDGSQYNVALSIYFVPYVLAEVPSNMIMQYFKRPSYYLGILVAVWGVVMTCTGLIQDFGQLVALRFLLGLFEAGLLPGAILLVSRWYMPNETQTRIAILYTSAATGGAFSGLLAYALAKMDGVGGYAGWRWIFIIEGLATILAAIMCVLFLIDSPALSTSWLDDDEIRYLELRQVARGLSMKQHRTSRVDWHAVRAAITDWKIYLLILANWSQAVPNYALKFSMPVIIKGMGFQNANAQVMTIPPYLCGAISSYLFSHFADRSQWRMPFVVAPQICIVVGYAVLFSLSARIKENIGPCYFAVCLACIGLYPVLPGVNAWNIANCAGPNKRAIGIAYLICVGNIGGLIGSYIYKDSEKPTYPTGYGTSLAFGAAGIMAALVLEFSLWTINKRNGRLSEADIREKYSEQQLEMLGDRSPLYTYAL